MYTSIQTNLRFALPFPFHNFLWLKNVNSHSQRTKRANERANTIKHINTQSTFRVLPNRRNSTISTFFLWRFFLVHFHIFTSFNFGQRVKFTDVLGFGAVPWRRLRQDIVNVVVAVLFFIVEISHLLGGHTVVFILSASSKCNFNVNTRESITNGLISSIQVRYRFISNCKFCALT